MQTTEAGLVQNQEGKFKQANKFVKEQAVSKEKVRSDKTKKLKPDWKTKGKV